MSEKNLSVLFNSLDNAKKTELVLDTYEIKELTLTQQKEILVTVFDKAETPARLGSALNKIILDSTKVINDAPITLVEKPFLLRALRTISIGDKITRTVTESDGDSEIEVKKHYTLLPIDFKNIKKFKRETEIKLDTDNKIKLVVPTLEKDSQFNKIAIQQINSYKKGCEVRHEIPKTGQYAAIYFTVEFMKYIDSIIIGSETFTFNKLTGSEQLRVVNNLPQMIIKQISDFIQTVKNLEKDCFSAKDNATNEIKQIEIDHLIFSTES